VLWGGEELPVYYSVSEMNTMTIDSEVKLLFLSYEGHCEGQMVCKHRIEKHEISDIQ
jgi:hypothetical protein